jgi:casein kinase 1
MAATLKAVHDPIEVDGSRYVLGDRIGTGSFGSVWEVIEPHNINGVTSLCVKLEPVATRKSLLELEYRVYCVVNQNPHTTLWFPRVVDLAEVDNERCLVMEMGNGDLLDGAPYNCDQLLDMLVDAICAVRALHTCGLLHRDIKPSNFVHHPRRPHGVMLVDMGLTKPFRDPKTHRHIENRKKTGMVGTVRFASTHTLMCMESSRRCDIESLVYTWVSLFGVRLPWHDLCSNKKKRRDTEMRAEVCRLKRITPPGRVVGGAPECLARILRDVRLLAFDARPNYDAYIRYINQYRTCI